jgi:MFS family permease
VPPLKNSFTLVTLYIAAFVGYAGFSLLFPVMPLYDAELGATIGQVGLIVAANSYMTAILLIPMGMLCDKFGRHKLLIGGLAVFAAVPLLYPLASNPAQLTLVRAIHGLGAAAFLPAAIALVIDLTPEAKRGEAIGWYTASLQLGLMAGPITGGFLLGHFGFDAVFFTCSAISLIALAFAFSRLRTISHPPPAEATCARSWHWLSSVLIFVGMLTQLLVAIGSGTISSYIPLYGREFGITEAGAGAIITALYGSSAILRAPAGKLADRVNKGQLIIGGLGITVIAVALVAVFHSLFPLIMVAVLFGVGMGIAMPASLALVAELAPARARGLAMAMGTAFFQIGFALGATAMGGVAGASDFETMFFACAASIAFGLLVLIGLMRVRSKQRDKELL